MEFSEKVLVLGIGKFKEADLWVRLLSPTKGVLSAFAFGGSRSKKRFVGCLDIFNEVLFRIQATNRGIYLTLQEGVLIKGTTRLRQDWSRHGMAMNCIKFTQSFGVDPDSAPKAYNLLEQTLCLLESSDNCSPLLPIFYRMRFVVDQGYAFDTNTCTHCGCSLEERTGYLFIQQGQLYCPSCRHRGDGASVFLGQHALAAMRTVMEQPVHLWPAAEHSETRTQCARAMEGYVQYHAGLSWKNGYFVKD